MKKLILLFLLAITKTLFCLNSDTTISELRGMEDLNGNTHLFYRLYSTTGNTIPGGYTNNIYHLDISNSTDSLFINSSVWEDSVILTENIVKDVEFWHNDPSEFIYTGLWWLDYEGGKYIKKYNKGLIKETNYYSGMGLNIEISKQNDSLLYSDGLYKSTDGGSNWLKLALPDYYLISVSPYNDNEIYVLDNNYRLKKTNDACRSFAVVDSFQNISELPTLNFLYDKDSVHIFSVETINGSYKLIVSNGKGEAGSWFNKYSSANSLYLSVDYAKSGIVYLAENKNIFVSIDYGDTFSLYKSLDSVIVGIYKKPGSDILYAATKQYIYEITSSSIKSIKQLVTAIVDKPENIPANYVLYQNYPNPFNPSTTITYEIPKSGLVQLKIYDILGREVASLVNAYQSAGKHIVVFDSQQSGKQLSSGVYFFRLKFGSIVLSKKMILLR
jgi:hypothetical protein